MPRRKPGVRRIEVPDAKFKARILPSSISLPMLDGKLALAERILYDALNTIEAQQKRAPLDVFDQAVKNATPTL